MYFIFPINYFFFFRNSELTTTHGSSSSENLKPQVLSPEKEDRYYATRASGFDDGVGKILTDGFDEKAFVWPKFFISLSCKEKEEDFMAMKGCKLPQRPKKRSKLIQKSIHVSLLHKRERLNENLWFPLARHFLHGKTHIAVSTSIFLWDNKGWGHVKKAYPIDPIQESCFSYWIVVGHNFSVMAGVFFVGCGFYLQCQTVAPLNCKNGFD